MEIRVGRLYYILSNQGGCRRGICTSFVHCKDYYSVLGVPRTATSKEIRSKYMELCKLYHPDKVINGNEKEKENQKVKFQEMSEAYENLSKVHSRSAHDSDLRSGAQNYTRTAYRGGNYTGYTQYNRRRYEGTRPPKPEDFDGWTSSWNEWDAYGGKNREKRMNEDEFYREQYMKNKRRWDDELNRYSAYRDYYRKSGFGTNDNGPYWQGRKFTNGQIVRACLSLIMFSILFHAFETVVRQKSVDSYYDRTRAYYQNYDDMRQAKVNNDDLYERTSFINRLQSQGQNQSGPNVAPVEAGVGLNQVR